MPNDSEKGKYTTPDGNAAWEYASAACCAFLIFCAFCVPSWITPTIDILTGPETPFPITVGEISTMAAVVGIGYMIAPFATVLIVDRIGRKNGLMVAGIPLIIAWGLTALAQNVTMLILSRTFGGIAMGLTMGVSPMYLGEIASPKLRGALGSICGLMQNFSTLAMFIIVPHLSIRTTACICLTVTIVSIISIWFIPDSPYFLAMVGRLDEAEISLEKLRGKTDVSEELELIKTTVQQKDKVTKDGEVEVKQDTGSLKLLFTVPANRKSFFINLLFAIVLSLGGAIVISGYCTIIIKAMKAPISSEVALIVTAILQLVSNIMTTFVVDRFGRRPLLYISGVASTTCLFILSAYFYLLERTETDVSQYTIIALCVFFMNLIATNMGLMPLQMVIQSEILATEIKAVSSSLIGVCGGFFAAIGIKFYIVIAISWNLGHAATFLILASITLFGVVLILKLLPETKGKTFLEIQNNFNK